jgi:hypothetical protein
MTRKTDDCDTKYRVTLIVDVLDPERLLKRASEMEAHLTAIVNEIGASARRARGEDDHEPEGVATIEEALCWVLPIIADERILRADGTQMATQSARPRLRGPLRNLPNDRAGKELLSIK